MFCSVIGCFKSADDGHIMKLLPKDYSNMNIWLKFVRLRPLVLSQDNQICEVMSIVYQWNLMEK